MREIKNTGVTITDDYINNPKQGTITKIPLHSWPSPQSL